MFKQFLLSLFVVTALSAGTISQQPAVRLRAAAGAPSSGECNSAGSVGKVYIRTDPAAVFSSFYTCSNTGASTYAWEGPYGTGGGGSNPVALTSGSGAPVASCTAPSGSNLALYSDTTGHKIWACVATNTWEIVLSTSGSGTLFIDGITGSDPCGTVASGHSCLFYDHTNSDHLTRKDDTQALHDTEGGGAVILAGNWNGSANPQVAGSTTDYIQVYGQLFIQALNNANVALTVHRSGTAQHLCITTADAQPGDGALTATLMSGTATATAVVATVAASAAAGEYCSSATASISSGNALSVKLVNASASASAHIYTVYVELQ